MDFGAANSLVSGVLEKLQQLRDEPQRVVQQLQKFHNIEWNIVTQRSCRNRNDGNRQLTPENLWKSNTFYPVMDHMLSSIRTRFEQNKEIFTAMSQFSPMKFEEINESVKNTEELATKISAYCESYDINKDECAKEL